MLAVSPALVSNVQVPANETADATADQAARLEPHATASAPLSGIVPDGGLHSVARAATAPQSNNDLQQMMQQLLGQLGNKLNVGGATTSANDLHPVANARANDPMSRLMQLLGEIQAQLTKQ